MIPMTRPIQAPYITGGGSRRERFGRRRFWKPRGQIRIARTDRVSGCPTGRVSFEIDHRRFFGSGLYWPAGYSPANPSPRLSSVWD